MSAIQGGLTYAGSVPSAAPQIGQLQQEPEHLRAAAATSEFLGQNEYKLEPAGRSNDAVSVNWGPQLVA
jgi:hypothetical protein